MLIGASWTLKIGKTFEEGVREVGAVRTRSKFLGVDAFKDAALVGLMAMSSVGNPCLHPSKP